MRILIVSDTHGYDENFFKACKAAGNVDFLIHAGDISGSERTIRDFLPCGVKMVLGNNDYSMSLKHEELFEVGGLNIYLTHGHRDGVHYGTDRLFYKAAERGADVVIYGHTHVPKIEYDEDLKIWAVNPGSLTYPRQEGHRPSFIIMEINEAFKASFSVKYL